jgi:hypothetical protein
MSFEHRVMRGDAICLLEESQSMNRHFLGGRKIPEDVIDVKIIQEWLHRCQKCHPLSCKPQPTDSNELRVIKLLDVSGDSNPHLVHYPAQPFEYIALSYVWGDTQKQKFQIGEVPMESLPQTIQDAIVLVRNLGMKYIWVDMVCIDQFDTKEKEAQIAVMADIYRAAYATIIAMSGPSASTGLPRMSSTSIIPQLRCRVSNRTIVGTMPTLSELIWVSNWGLRAWTLQEALLSRRCIYLSDYQMYSECNAMQCSESLDDSHSPVHQQIRDEKTNTSAQKVGGGCLRHPSKGNNPA